MIESSLSSTLSGPIISCEFCLVCITDAYRIESDSLASSFDCLDWSLNSSFVFGGYLCVSGYSAKCLMAYVSSLSSLSMFSIILVFAFLSTVYTSCKVSFGRVFRNVVSFSLSDSSDLLLSWCTVDCEMLLGLISSIFTAGLYHYSRFYNTWFSAFYSGLYHHSLL